MPWGCSRRTSDRLVATYPDGTLALWRFTAATASPDMSAYVFQRTCARVGTDATGGKPDPPRPGALGSRLPLDPTAVSREHTSVAATCISLHPALPTKVVASGNDARARVRQCVGSWLG